MRVLIDECVDPRVKLLFSDHEVSTVHERGWDTFEDGPLLAIAQKDFDVLLTID
jgi:predicted nuclease of predicted toxin-antitoxin system